MDTVRLTGTANLEDIVGGMIVQILLAGGASCGGEQQGLRLVIQTAALEENVTTRFREGDVSLR